MSSDVLEIYVNSRSATQIYNNLISDAMTHTWSGRLMYLAMAFFSKKKKSFFPSRHVFKKVENCIIPSINPTGKIVVKIKSEKLSCKPSY